MASSSTRIVMVSLMIIFAMVSSPLMLESEAARIPHRELFQGPLCADCVCCTTLPQPSCCRCDCAVP
ncbi:hypothetical protein LOK49_LG14G01995 [Camellia lanceoleosa]|uniref:Uncharacterized protein n=1 Tax=Camellia lanceoleosa TaxID=1840588 RepID=A0ACC0FDH8_9ERIC|nr:hypothetical protein LOK49_LG14G01995 [Camellia lanceoleosa]